MDAENSINLLTPRAKVSPQLTTVGDVLAKWSMVGLVALLLVSTLTTVFYFIVKARYTALVARRDQLRSRIVAEIGKEGLLVSVRDRARIAEKLLTGQTNWAALLERMNQIAPQPTLSSIVVDENRSVVLNTKLGAIEDAFPILTGLLGDVEAKKIFSPRIVSFQLDKDGLIKMVVSFVPIL